MQDNYDLIVIGAGPGGYVAAIRGAQLGMKVAVVEKRETLGGVCLNEGCIPSKALLDSSELFALARERFAGHGIEIGAPSLNLERMMGRKEEVVRKLTDGIAYLFNKHKIARIAGEGRPLGAQSGGEQEVEVHRAEGVRQLSGKRVLLATGSEAVQLPALPFDGKDVVSAREALSFTRVPEHLVVVGGGYIGLELGSVWLRLGSKVTVVEMLPRLVAGSDGQVADVLMKSLKRQGMEFLMGRKVAGAQRREGGILLTLEGEGDRELSCDKVLVAVGRRPLTEGLELERLGVRLEKGRVAVDENYGTSVPGIYAIGDLVAGPMLAHKAMEEGVVFAERLAGHKSIVEYGYLPGVCYTWPEAASVGKTEEALKEEGVPYEVGRFNFIGNGRARCMDETEGFVKVLAQKGTGRVLGVHILGPRASDMIAEAVTVMSFGGSAEDIALTIHSHPTLSEALREAALDVRKEAIHA